MLTQLKMDATADLRDVHALTFDIFGTAVDWRSGVAAEARRIGAANGVSGDWERLADAWRALYAPSMDRVRRGDLPWTNFDRLHRMSLDQVLHDLGIEFDLSAREELTLSWERLPAWPDAAPGLRGWRGASPSRPCRTAIDPAGGAGPIRRITLPALAFSGGLRHYKPDPEVYLGAASALGLEAHQVMMVAAHKGDLRAAQAAGCGRPSSSGRSKRDRAEARTCFLIHRRRPGTRLVDLAEKLGC